MFDFRRATAFCLGCRLSKHKVTRYAKNLGGHGASWLCLWRQNRLWARGTCFVFTFTLDYEAYTGNQSIVATYDYDYVGFRAYCTLLWCVCVLKHIKINKQKIWSNWHLCTICCKTTKKLKTLQNQNLGYLFQIFCKYSVIAKYDWDVIAKSWSHWKPIKSKHRTEAEDLLP